MKFIKGLKRKGLQQQDLHGKGLQLPLKSLVGFLATSAILTTSLVSTQALSQDIDLESLKGKAGYSVGVNIGTNLAAQGVSEDLDVDALLQGLDDAINGELKMSQEEIVAAIQEFSAQQQIKAEAAVALEVQANQEFMANNATQPDVTTTDSGLQYLVLEEVSENSPKPTEFNTVEVHYHGTLINGTVFDSSVVKGETVSFPLNGVIPGWTEGLQLMKVGEKFRFFIPSDLAYGANGMPQGGIGPNVPLIFEVELISIE